MTPLPPTPIITQSEDTLLSNATTGNQWYNLATGYINNANGQTYTPQQTGSYFVLVALNGCYSDTSNIVYYIYTGIEKIENNSRFSIYPNPANDMVYIKLKTSDMSDIVMSIYNSLGQRISVNNITSDEFQINVSKYNKGIYYIIIEGKENIQINGKFIVE